MAEVDRLVARMAEAFDGAPWYGPSLRSALDGVTSAEAFATPVPGAHGIAELVRHLTWWKRVVRRRLQGDPVSDANAVDWPPLRPRSRSWRALRADLQAAHAELVTEVRALTPRALNRTVPGQSIPIRAMLHGVADHDIYHAGQVVLLRRALEESR